MRDAMGGTVSLVIVSVFIVIALGYMAFNVNYTKAFRMKDKIISLYDDYEGDCNADCKNAIKEYANKLGYATDNSLNCGGDGWTSGIVGLYCVKEIDAVIQRDEHNTNDIVDDMKQKHYFKIKTKININIPIINNVFDFKFFYITGDTKAYEKK